MNKTTVLEKILRCPGKIWLHEETFNDLADEALHVRLGNEAGKIELLYRDIVISVSISEKFSEYSGERNVFAKVSKIQKINSDYVRIPSGVLYEFPEDEFYWNIL